MNTCSDGHKEICYNGHDCPLCEAIVDPARTTTTRDELDDDLSDAKQTIEELEAEIKALTRRLEERA